jgi:hypothetical protein
MPALRGRSFPTSTIHCPARAEFIHFFDMPQSGILRHGRHAEATPSSLATYKHRQRRHFATPPGVAGGGGVDDHVHLVLAIPATLPVSKASYTFFFRRRGGAKEKGPCRHRETFAPRCGGLR